MKFRKLLSYKLENDSTLEYSTTATGMGRVQINGETVSEKSPNNQTKMLPKRLILKLLLGRRAYFFLKKGKTEDVLHKVSAFDADYYIRLVITYGDI